MDKIPCLCGHDRWIHNAVSTDPQLKRCHDFNWDYPCKCTSYRMNNLVYLERIDKHELDRINSL